MVLLWQRSGRVGRRQELFLFASPKGALCSFFRLEGKFTENNELIFMGEYIYTPPKNAPKSTADLLLDLKEVANKNNTTKLTLEIYSRDGKYDPTTITRRFGTWNKALEKVNLSPGNIGFYADEELFENILNIWQKIGRQPTRREIDADPSSISSGPYKRRFITWTEAMKSFVKYMNEREIILINPAKSSNISVNTNRDPSLRLRFKVLKRDDFSCVHCGASPAKDPVVELQVDHIVPWSKGGKTEITNLQTLCRKCNLGKGNIL